MVDAGGCHHRCQPDPGDDQVAQEGREGAVPAGGDGHRLDGEDHDEAEGEQEERGDEQRVVSQGGVGLADRIKMR